MTKVKLAEATKEINQQAATMLEEAGRIRRSLESVLSALNRLDSDFQRREEEERLRKHREEQESLANTGVLLDEITEELNKRHSA